jgi:hypothetical protein
MYDQYFTTFDIKKAIEAPVDQQQLWISNEWIFPTVPSPGRGKPALFDLDGVISVAFFKEMLALGIARKIAGKHVEHFLKHKAEKPRWAAVVVREEKTETHFLPYKGEEGKGDFLVLKGDAITLRNIKPIIAVHLINIERIREEVIRKIGK